MSRYILISLIFIGQAAWAQQAKLDSIEQVLKEVDSDSLRIQALLEKARLYAFVGHDIAKKAANEATALAEANNWNWAKLQCYHNQSLLSTLRGDYTAALKYSNMRLPIAIDEKDTAHMANTINFLGNTYFELGDFDEAYFYFTRSYRLAETIRDSVQAAIALHNVGNVFRELGQYDIALSHLELSRKMSERAGDIDGAAYSAKEIGDVYLQEGDFAKAEEMLMKALGLTRKLHIKILEPEVLHKLAELYLKTHDYEKAYQYYDSAGELNALIKNELGTARARLGKALVYLNQGKYENALSIVTEILSLSKELNARRLEIKCIRALSDLYERMGDFEQSLKYLQEYNQRQDTLFSQDMLQKLFQGQIRFQMETRDLQIAALNRTKELQATEIKQQEFIRNILVVVVALTVILLFTVYRSGQRRIRINKLLVEHQGEIKRRSIELEQLNQVKDKFFSIISHDLRSPINALAGILDLIDRGQIKPEEFQKIIRELKIQFNHTKSLINNLLDWTLLQMDKLKVQHESISLRPMVEENFRLLSSLQLKEMQLVNEVPDGLTAYADTNMINLVLRNLILNAMKFTESGGTIRVTAQMEEDYVLAAVEDNGVGIAQQVQNILFEKKIGYSTRGTANEKGTGLGLILCKEFVERNGGKIWLKSEVGKGSTFYFTIPQEQRQD